MDAHPLETPRIGVEHLELEILGPGDQLAASRDAPGQRDDEAAQRIDVLGHLAVREVEADHARRLLEIGAGVGDEGVGAARLDHRLAGEVVLVFDVADHHLDQVLDRDEPVRAAVLVDDERHVGSRRLHAHEQLHRRHRGRHEQDRAEDTRRGERRREVDVGQAHRVQRLGPLAPRTAVLGPGHEVIEKIADVDHAFGVVERLAVDR